MHFCERLILHIIATLRQTVEVPHTPGPHHLSNFWIICMTISGKFSRRVSFSSTCFTRLAVLKGARVCVCHAYTYAGVHIIMRYGAHHEIVRKGHKCPSGLKQCTPCIQHKQGHFLTQLPQHIEWLRFKTQAKAIFSLNLHNTSSSSGLRHKQGHVLT